MQTKEIDVSFQGVSELIDTDKGENLPEFYRSKNFIKIEGPFKTNDYIKLKGRLISGDVILVLASDYGKTYWSNYSFIDDVIANAFSNFLTQISGYDVYFNLQKILDIYKKELNRSFRNVEIITADKCLCEVKFISKDYASDSFNLELRGKGDYYAIFIPSVEVENIRARWNFITQRLENIRLYVSVKSTQIKGSIEWK